MEFQIWHKYSDELITFQWSKITVTSLDIAGSKMVKSLVSEGYILLFSLLFSPQPPPDSPALVLQEQKQNTGCLEQLIKTFTSYTDIYGALIHNVYHALSSNKNNMQEGIPAMSGGLSCYESNQNILSSISCIDAPAWKSQAV